MTFLTGHDGAIISNQSAVLLTHSERRNEPVVAVLALVLNYRIIFRVLIE